MPSSFLEHANRTIKRIEESNARSSGGNFAKENIWFDWGNSDEHVIRLVGDWREVHSHWIGASKFGKDVAILKPTAFVGDSKLPMSVSCDNWDASTETEETDACPVCRLAKKADWILNHPKYANEIDEADKENFKAVRRKCAVKINYIFKCIDRENPYVDDEKTRKGYKIIKMPQELWNAILEMGRKIKGVEIASVDEGIDITIKRQRPANGQKGKTTYTASPVYDGMTVKQTPLTDEEKAFRDIDLLKFIGKPVDKDRFESELVEENNIRMLYEMTDADTGAEPF